MYRVTFGASLLLVSSFAVATPTQDQVLIEQQQALQAAMDAASAELLMPGPKREGWNKGGVDLDKIVQSAPGGVVKNYLLGIDKDGERTVTIIRARDLLMVPADWKSVLDFGEISDLATSDGLSITRMDGAYYVAGWEHVRRVGNAFCSTGKFGAKLYNGPAGREKSELPSEMIPALFNVTMQLLQKRTICWRFDRVGNGYSTTYFLEDGRTLPALNEYAEVTTIVPAGPIEALLASPPSRP